MTPDLNPVKWSSLEPQDAVGIDLRHESRIVGPLNERGVLCPWPWEVQQAEFDPSGMHICSYCGQVSTPGLEHPDFTEIFEETRT